MTLAYLDPGSGTAIATVVASGVVGVSAVWGSARRRLTRRHRPEAPATETPGADGPEDRA